ncbi:cytochrome b5-like heme/steroid binding domain-containing protein [Russula vinacea]|nr:cytochrome b5-like heme/steroid binding domain-containing protein [Russula vinacea]
MSSYLRSWLPTLSLRQSRPATATEEEEGEEEESPTTPTNPSFSFQKPDDGDDDDAPPAFPAIASAQRISSRAPASTLMPPPSIPASRRRIPGPPAPSSSSPPTQLSKSKKRAKVVLAPGHSPLDWAALKSSGTDLRGGATALARIPPSVLRLHNKRDDAWAAFNGKVYNITPYLDFHPGGEKELMRVAGRDGTKLFSLTHAWVNVDFMLDACLVGFWFRSHHLRSFCGKIVLTRDTVLYSLTVNA